MIGTGCSKKEGKYLTYTYFLLIFFIISCVTTHIIFSLYLSCSNYIYHYSNNKVCIVGMTYRFLSLLLKRAAWFTTIVLDVGSASDSFPVVLLPTEVCFTFSPLTFLVYSLQCKIYLFTSF